jgi:Ser/Thr protein kinase RdoA (MazF antagonist)
VIEWASAHGLPAIRAIPSEGGDTLQEVNGRVVAVFPWRDGHPLQRGYVTLAQAAAMGAMHGQLHSVLLGYTDPDLRWFWDSWGANADPSGTVLAQLLRDLPNFELPPDERDLIGRSMELQLRLLKRATSAPDPHPSMPGVQPVHGDYHERNVLFDETNLIVAVVDWDMVATMPRAFEVVRCLSFAELLETPLLEAYLNCYGKHVTLSAAECAAAVELWWQFLVSDTWLYRNRLLEGDPGVQRFFGEQIGRLEQFTDASFRTHLAAELRRLVGPRPLRRSH